MTRPWEEPVHPKPLDIGRPLFDSRGNPHSVVLCSEFQLLTAYRGLFFVWDRHSGESLMSSEEGCRLSNDVLPDGRWDQLVTYEDRRLMRQAAMVIDCLRRSSLAEIKAGKRDRGGGGAEGL